MRFEEFSDLPTVYEIEIVDASGRVEMIVEGKWVSGRFERNIRIDHPNHGAGQTHAHVLGRKGEEIGVVNFDGSSSHGTKCKLSDDDANALRDRGFSIPKNNVVEWLLVSKSQTLLLG